MAKRKQRRTLAKGELLAAEERLRVVQSLGDPPTILQAMKDRDAAEITLAAAQADLKLEVTKQLYADCKWRATAKNARARANAI